MILLAKILIGKNNRPTKNWRICLWLFKLL
jgi:hypothetical protein